MQIILTDEDITQALSDYISNMGVNLDNKDVSSSITAGRQGKGNTATVTITKAVTTPSTISQVATPTPRSVDETATKETDNTVEDEPTTVDDDTPVFSMG